MSTLEPRADHDKREASENKVEGGGSRQRDRGILPRQDPEWCQTTTWMNGALVWRFLRERLQPKNKPTSE
jgi:hypothetical protein